MKVLLVGAGYMATEYAKVLEAMKIDYLVIGRSRESAVKFEATFDKKVICGGLESNLNEIDISITHAIIATSLNSLVKNTICLLEHGIDNILIEKPGSSNLQGLLEIESKRLEKNANVYIAYNRRFYASVLEARNRIANDGGLTSFLFEFTEWSHVLTNLSKSSFELEHVFIGNSTHVVDLAFFFGSLPKSLSNYVVSNLAWHPNGSIFSGAGVTEENLLFSYHANWESPGSWKLELLTKKNRFIFRPIEELHVQRLGSVQAEKIEIDNSLDLNFKPGLYRQIEQFLLNIDHSELLSVTKGIKQFYWYEKMLSKSGGI